MGKIPQIDSIEELARFWDTHDITDFEDELEEVEEPVFDGRTPHPSRNADSSSLRAD